MINNKPLNPLGPLSPESPLCPLSPLSPKLTHYNFNLKPLTSYHGYLYTPFLLLVQVALDNRDPLMINT